MNYTYLSEDERIQIAAAELREQEINIFRQELVVAAEPFVQMHKDKLTALKSTYDKLATAAPKKVIVDEPLSPAA